MQSQNEPICALITPPGYAAINVLRISGHGSSGIVAQFFRPRAKLLKSPSHTAVFGTFFDKGGHPLDQLLCTVFRAPHSYTGEECVEISCHGNPRIASRILENLLVEARLARPGEFTLRALLNGKLDLTQAEAVNDLITATGSKAEAAALMQVQGVLGRHLQGLLDAITEARLRCELAIDFADQDLPQLDLEDLDRRISDILEQAKALHSEGSRGKLIREGIRVCLAGPPNSGKSSLFNAFLKFNRAIVTPHPGTTRDYLEESVSLHGYTLVLYDTAGLRESEDSSEKEGIRRSRELMQNADLVLFLNEAAAAGTTTESEELPENLYNKILWVASKFDLLMPACAKADSYPARDGLSPQTGIPVSVQATGGMEALCEAILQRFELPDEIPQRPLVTNARQFAALSRCVTAMQSAQKSLREQAGFEFTAFDLTEASQALEEILGIVTADDLLERIFSGFCIGK
ncbi:MAG TPA: tRNA uridine-5-carboxymethylaminomethyl(34) synthesis GTPase MnmE [Candidatus Syntrophosphaera sp.]|nr:tRNA uridine-5-carboxymethylaminomethyl(34) synthesis GTPase MnmE [Candidatus Syntrophosphaera sp.]